MACYKPIQAYATASGGVVFSELKRHGEITKTMWLACGQCSGCRLERSRQWAVRIMHEAQMHKKNSFLTLTYDNKNLPEHNSLKHRDFVLFMKKLRKKHDVKFYMCGEYGEETGRPHYHACIFGEDFAADRYKWKENGGYPLYRSPELEKLWKHGQSAVGELTFESAAYTARYIMKKITGDAATAHYTRLTENGELVQITPEYCQMSRKEGIGRKWLETYWEDVKNGEVIVRGKVAGLPRFYKKYFKNTEHKHIIDERAEELYNHADNTRDRLATREKVTIARINQYKRNFEI